MADTKIKTLTELLGALQRGAFHDKVTREINELLSTMGNLQDEQGGTVKGEVTIKLSFSLADFFTVTPVSVVKEPKEANHNTVFFRSSDNMLDRKDANQSELPLEQRRAERAEQQATA